MNKVRFKGVGLFVALGLGATACAFATGTIKSTVTIDGVRASYKVGDTIIAKAWLIPADITPNKGVLAIVASLSINDIFGLRRFIAIGASKSALWSMKDRPSALSVDGLSKSIPKLLELSITAPAAPGNYQLCSYRIHASYLDMPTAERYVANSSWDEGGRPPSQSASAGDHCTNFSVYR